MKGFTLVEILVTLGIFTLLIGLGLFMSLETYRGSLHRSERDTIVSVLQRARSRAMANVYESPHGVCVDGAAYNIICTDGGDCPNEVEDVVESKGDAVTVTGIPTCSSSIAFEQLTGNLVGAVVAIEIQEEGRPSQTITINEQGTILW